eukprot:TRINITY_DN2332_c0_g1_i3.p1 TRINITY_DN2332_c0_g1~~TRINITY_DN2332_c0_g1_i3.p1  ORF type:complete len:121 (-),score=13.53 TRINITY_DN2332_c0_g1_i3:413-775(-)
MDDWYRVSRGQLYEVGASGFLSSFSRLYNALEFGYPEYQWDSKAFVIYSKKSVQRLLKKLLFNILPVHITIEEDFHHPNLTWEDEPSLKMTLDVWIPELHLAVEYQGKKKNSCQRKKRET